MLPQKQRFTGNEPSKMVPLGDCFRTTVACVTDRDIECVPHFILFGDSWPVAFEMWLAETNSNAIIYTDDEQRAAAWRELEFLVKPLNSAPKNEYLVSAGKSPNGDWDHSVITFNGEIVHDPHPSNKGLAEPAYEHMLIVEFPPETE